MFTPENNDIDGKPTMLNDFRAESKFSAFLKRLFVFFLLLAVIAASFWVSFIFGKRILMPVKKTAQSRIVAPIPEPPPSIAGLQKIEDVPAEPVVKVKKSTAVKEVKKPRVAKKKYYPHTYYKVQAGVFKHKGNALTLANKLNKQGLSTYIKKIKKGYYRVQVGAFKTKGRALALQKEIKKKGFESIIIYE